jgi:transposase
MKKVSTGAARQTKNFRIQKLTIGLDLGDRSSWYCGLDETGELLLEQRLSTTAKTLRDFAKLDTRKHPSAAPLTPAY